MQFESSEEDWVFCAECGAPNVFSQAVCGGCGLPLLHDAGSQVSSQSQSGAEHDELVSSDGSGSDASPAYVPEDEYLQLRYSLGVARLSSVRRGKLSRAVYRWTRAVQGQRHEEALRLEACRRAVWVAHHGRVRRGFKKWVRQVHHDAALRRAVALLRLGWMRRGFGRWSRQSAKTEVGLVQRKLRLTTLKARSKMQGTVEGAVARVRALQLVSLARLLGAAVQRHERERRRWSFTQLRLHAQATERDEARLAAAEAGILWCERTSALYRLDAVAQAWRLRRMGGATRRWQAHVAGCRAREFAVRENEYLDALAAKENATVKQLAVSRLGAVLGRHNDLRVARSFGAWRRAVESHAVGTALNEQRDVRKPAMTDGIRIRFFHVRSFSLQFARILYSEPRNLYSLDSD